MEETTGTESLQYQSGETITISLEDASQLMQGIEGGILPPGTYQIVTQDGLQLTDGSLDSPVGFTVVQTIAENITDLQDSQHLDINQSTNQSVMETEQSNTEMDQSDIHVEEIDQSKTVQDRIHPCLEEPSVQNDVLNETAASKLNTNPSLDTSNKMLENTDVDLNSDIPKSGIGNADTQLSEENNLEKAEISQTGDTVSRSTEKVKKISNCNGILEDNNTENKDHKKMDAVQSPENDTETKQIEAEMMSQDNALSTKLKEFAKSPNEIHAEVLVLPALDDTYQPVSPVINYQKTQPKHVDLSQPIAVTHETEITLNGKKCILRPHPDTGQLCAFPVLPPEGKRKRGRPPKRDSLDGSKQAKSEKRVDPVLKMKTKDQTNAAESLLELSNTGPDGVRRSGRARKKAKTLDDYEVLEAASDDEGTQPVNEEEDEDAAKVIPSLRRKFKMEGMESEKTGFSTVLPLTSPTPVKRGRGRPRRYPPPGQSSTQTQIPAVIIPGANGQTLMMAPIQGLSNFQSFQQQIKKLPEVLSKMPVVSSVSVGSTTSTTVTSSNFTTISVPNDDSIATNTSDALPVQPLPVVVVEPDVNDTSEDVNENNIEDDSQEDENENSLMVKTEAVSPIKDLGTEKDGSEDDKTDENEPTIIQIPENLLPMFLPKNNPVRLGLKFSEKELDDLRCPKCNFQTFYPNQYQAHIATHTEETQKCKCCSFVSLDRESLLQHFKSSHPRCICNICDFMAEHAYVIKRHMMRHTAEGCTCEICGKTYKDQYILKMHVKMVHMPAEILFECTVCSKKFTRKAHLKRHLRIHEPEKPFKCPHCDYRGCERSDISKHILIHEEPRHVCEVCCKAFRHIKNKLLHLKRHNGQRDYKCGVCDFFGYTFTDIRKHIERKHSEIKTLFCDKCGAAFKSEAILRDHQKQQCEMFMIEQALAIATSTGTTSQATIQIPSSSLTMDTNNFIDTEHVNITVEQVNMHDDDEDIALAEEKLNEEELTEEHLAEEELTEEQLTEEQLEEEHLQGSFQDNNLTIADAQVIEAVVSQGHVMEQADHIVDQTFEGHVEVINGVASGNDIESETSTQEDVNSMMQVVTDDGSKSVLTEHDGELTMEMT